jgi:serine/threonine-protein kinase
MRTFEHPNVVKTIASGITSEGQPYLVMEFLGGQTLAEKIHQEGSIPPEQVALYLSQIANALDAAHARGIVHRDINPNAVMIQDEPGGQPIVKLLDFGLAKDLSNPSGSQMELTSKQTSLGTAAYLSPEQARGGEVDGRSDVYGLGVTLYEALTGRLPFEGENDFQILLSKINGSIPPVLADWSDHANASAMESVVSQALASNPTHRPATAGILSTMFEEALSSQPSRKIGLAWPVFAVIALTVIGLIFLAKWFR